MRPLSVESARPGGRSPPVMWNWRPSSSGSTAPMRMSADTPMVTVPPGRRLSSDGLPLLCSAQPMPSAMAPSTTIKSTRRRQLKRTPLRGRVYQTGIGVMGPGRNIGGRSGRLEGEQPFVGCDVVGHHPPRGEALLGAPSHFQGVQLAEPVDDLAHLLRSVDDEPAAA